MSKISLHIDIVKTNTSHPYQIGIHEFWLKKRNIPLHGSTSVQYGSARCPVQVTKSSQKHKIQLSPELASKLGIYTNMPTQMKYIRARKTISLGPLLGVLVSRYREQHADRPFAKSTGFCRELTEACQSSGTSVFFFTPQDIKKVSSMIHGHAYEQGAWKSRTFPVPHVIYNRLTSRRFENLAHVKNFFQSVKKHHRTQVFNERYLNKAEVFQALRKEKNLNTVLPESHLFSNAGVFKKMAQKYSLLFLKPITGSLGKGIIKLRKLDHHKYETQLTQSQGVRTQRFSSFNAVTQWLNRNVKTKNYQIQQGLHLLTINQRPLDFRALVQRDEKGKWKITSIVARIASGQHYVSNLARGGNLSPVKEALAKTAKSANATRIIQQLRTSTIAIAQGIENQIESHFGELGVDLAVDKNGKVWLLEVNSKPSKDDHTAVQGKGKIRPSVKNVVKYTRHLAHF